jgi:beta-lactamase regulating signal transducer with metallopeptidase domain/lipopolysaccharide export system protein LptA
MNIESHFAPLLDLLVKSAVLILAGAALVAALRKSSAANRHSVSVAVFAALLLLPFTKLMPARWSFALEKPAAPAVSVRLPVIKTMAVSTESVSAPTVEKIAQPTPRTPLVIPWKKLAVTVWLTGAALLLARRALIGLRLRSIVRRSFPIEDEQLATKVHALVEAGGVRAEVRESEHCRVPLASGMVRPVVLLPAEAADWSDAFISSALRHELGHVRRRDCVTRLLADVLCAIYWVNPLVWFAARQMRLAQEQACDDLVLNAGAPADEYAGQLVEVVRNLQGDRFTARHALAMAQPSTLETRVLAIVDASRDRSARSVRGTSAGLALGTTMLALCTVAQLCGADEKKPALAAAANAPQVEIEAKFIEFSGKPEDLPELLQKVAALKSPGVGAVASGKAADDAWKAIEKVKGADLLSSPRVIARSKQEAKIEVGQEMRYAKDWEWDGTNKLWVPREFDTKVCGVSFTVTPEVNADRTINMRMAPEVTEFEKFIPIGEADPKNPENQRKKPVFHTRKMDTAVKVTDGQTVALGGMGMDAVQKIADKKPGTGEAEKREERSTKQLIVLVTARIVKQDAAAAKDPQQLEIASDTMTLDKKTGKLVASGNVKIETGQATITAAQAEITPKKTGAAAAAEKIIFPKIDFRDATVREVIEFLAEKSKRLDGKGEGVNIVIRNAEKIGEARITLALSNVPLLEMLRYVAELANCELVPEEFALVVGPKQPGKTPAPNTPAAPAAPAAAKPVEAALKKADAIIFPRIDFRDATLAECVEFLVIKSRTLDAEGKGVNIVVNGADKIREAKLTLNLSRVPLTEVLRYVAALADCELVREEFAFVIRPKQEAAKAPAKPDGAAVKKANAINKAGTIIFPKIDLRDATLSETVDFLRTKAKELDPDKQGVNLILRPRADGTDPKITLSLANIPLGDAIMYIVELAGFECTADEHAITISPAAK